LSTRFSSFWDLVLEPESDFPERTVLIGFTGVFTSSRSSFGGGTCENNDS